MRLIRPAPLVRLLVRCGLLALCCLLVAQPARAAVVYVSAAVANSGDGSSWALAKKTVAEGFNAATSGDEVWIRTGAYVESITVPAGVSVFGGFAGDESAREERDPAANPVLIYAPAGAMYAVAIAVSDVVLDGLEITGGSVASVRCANGGTGIAIVNCEIHGGPAEGIRCYYTSPDISACFIHSNGDDGIYCTYASPVVAGCTIAANGTYGINCSHSAPDIDSCLFISNQLTGIYVASSSSPYVTNALVVGHGASGIVVTTASSLTMANSGFASNTPSGYGTGGAIYLSSGLITLRNSWLVDNTRKAIRENSGGTNIVTNCLFDSNPDGDYFDYENWTTYTGATAINTNVNGASDNIDGDPFFEGSYIGTWTDDPVENTTTNTVTLVDGNANYTEGELVGVIINCDTSQRGHGLVVANTATTIEVVGLDITSYAQSGDTYATKNYRIVETSPCVDVGVETDAPDNDLDGYARPVDVPLQGDDGTGTEYDIGPYEFQADLSDKDLRIMAIDGGGTVEPGDGTYTYGATANLVGTPKRGCTFNHWFIRQNIDPPATPEEFSVTTNPYELSMTKDWDVWAYFDGTPQYILTVDAVGPGQVTPSGGTYDENTEVVITATADSESEFVRWEGDAAGSENPLTVVMDDDKTITAIFSATYELTTSVSGSGSVSPSGGTYLAGTQVEVLATPAPGWAFWYWQGAVSGSANPATIVMDQAKSVVAVFSLILPDLSVIVTEPQTLTFANAGDNLTVEWTVANSGFDTATGNWTDAVYLSRDNSFDTSDRLVASVARSSPVAVGSNYSESINCTIPDVAPGKYFLIVCTDVENTVAEVDETTAQTVEQTITIQDFTFEGTR